MPVSTGSLGEPRAKRCKHCDESSHRSESGSGYWQLQLDRDLVETISAIYPEWFKSNMAEGGLPGTPRASPPKAVVDTSPLLNSLEQNKESLKVKLMLRRPVDQLVAQGIMPPLKAPPAFHGQRRQLERAKTGDMLKAKIQQRPPRQELERRHILESDPAHVDPSLAEKQRMLKKARLADQLNDQLSHRPGPLELIQKNILHTEEPIEHAVKAGHIPYKATCEGQLNRPQHPISYINPEDDSQSSEDNLVSPGPSDVIETAAKSAGIVVSLIPATEGTVVVTTATPILTNKDNCSELVFTPLIQNRSAASPASLVSSTSTLSPLSSVASPVPSIVSQPTTPIPPPLPTIPYATRPTKCDAPGKDKNRKKSKSKSTPKTRTIKFHEYKGPPSAQKSSSANNNNNGESSYDLLLQQQTLLLQFQLQLQHKYPQIILPASQKVQNEASAANMNNPLPSPASSTTSESTTTSTRLIGKLEDMKVSDLKAELKRRNLPVSGSKPQLIERLKPFLGDLHITQHPDSTTSSKSLSEDVQHNSPVMQHSDIGSPQASSIDDMEAMDTINPMSPLPQPMQVQCIDSVEIQEDIVKKQQKQIEELQRELTLSQLKLKAVTTAEPKAQLIALQKHLQARQQQQQLVEQIQMNNLKARQEQEQQQRIQQQQHVAFQNQKNLTGGLVLTDASLLNHLVQGSKKLSNGHNRTNSLPNFLHGIVTPVISPPEVKEEIEEEVKPPPLYEEATKQIKKEKNNVKSQIVDDVLEILIKNGELPPSAAQDPSTPNSAGTRSVEPVFSPPQQQQPTDNNVPEPVLNIDPDFLGCPLDNMDINQLVMDLAHPSADGNQNIEHDSVPMDTDEWLESLLPNDNQNSNQNVMVPQDSGIGGYDPLLGIAQDPFDPFCLEDFRSPPDVHASLSWDYA